MKLTVETITPEKAAQWLPKFMTKNRNVRDATVEKYATDMKAGNWRLTGETIKWNGNRGVDGQHRLAACLLAGVPFKSAVAWDVPTDAHVAIDTGAARTLSDELRFRGEHNTAQLGSVLNQLWRYDNDLYTHRVYASRQTLINVLLDNPEVRRSAGLGDNKVGILGTSLSTAHYIAWRDSDPTEADAWLARIKSDEGHVDGDPALAMRRFAANARNTSHQRVLSETWLALLIKSYNAWLAGDKVHNLRWRRGGSQAEKFPRINKPL